MTKSEFKRLIESKIVILDGATGSNLQKKECILVYVRSCG